MPLATRDTGSDQNFAIACLAGNELAEVRTSTALTPGISSFPKRWSTRLARSGHHPLLLLGHGVADLEDYEPLFLATLTT